MKNCALGMLILCAMMLNTAIATGEEMVIAAGKNVKFEYVLTVDGKVIDSSEGKAPLEYTQGQKMIIPGLESQMEGLQVGDKKTIIVTPEKAYGIIDPRAVVEVPTAQLGTEITPEVGMMLQMTGESGQPIPGKIMEIKENSVMIDFNHPLAGKTLQFDIEIVEIK